MLAAGSRLALDIPAVYYIVSGRVRCEHISEAGREASAGVLGPGETFVHRRQWLPGSPETFVEALQDSRLLVLREREMSDFVTADPRAAARVMAALARRVGDVTEVASDLALVDARRRVLRALVRLADRHGEPDPAGEFHRIVVPLKHQDLAALVGACRETVTSVLADLGRHGVVRTSRRCISVNRHMALTFLEDCSVQAAPA